MNKKSILVLFCEGKHDSNFISIILESMGYNTFKEPIDQLPSCFSYISEKVKTLNPEVFSMGQLSADRFLYPFPWIFEKEKTIIALYRLDGLNKITDANKKIILKDKHIELLVSKGIKKEFFSDSIRSIEYSTIRELWGKLMTEVGEISKEYEDIIRNYAPRREIYETIELILRKEKDTFYPANFNTPVNFAFIVDADEEGIDKRVNSIRASYKQYFTGIDLNLQAYKPLKLSDKRNIGLFVITKEKDTNGDLEDLVISIINKKGEFSKLLNNADKFVTENEDDFSEGSKITFYPKKSKIGVAGQMRCSGEDLGTILRRSGFIDPLHGSFKDNSTIIRIKSFINEMFT